MNAVQRLVAAEATLALSQRVDELVEIDRADYVGKHRNSTD